MNKKLTQREAALDTKEKVFAECKEAIYKRIRSLEQQKRELQEAVKRMRETEESHFLYIRKIKWQCKQKHYRILELERAEKDLNIVKNILSNKEN